MSRRFLLAALIPCAAHAQQMRSVQDERRAEDYAQSEVDRKQAVLDRKELVTPPPKDFHPSATAHSIKVKLSLEKSKVRLGEPLQYRLEIINLGSEPFNYFERPSFFKSGRMPHDRINLIVRTPDGSTATLRSPYGRTSSLGGDEIEFPSGTSESQKAKKMILMQRDANAASTLFVTLAPGESLRTRGDDPKSTFRRLITRDKFASLGEYELRAELDGLLRPGLSSNTVRFTVTR